MNPTYKKTLLVHWMSHTFLKPSYPGPGDPPERMGGRTFFGRIVQLFQAHFGMKQQATKDPKTHRRDVLRQQRALREIPGRFKGSNGDIGGQAF